ncbi:MAG: alkaline phosphatase D family protein [Myxococcota bacterium]
MRITRRTFMELCGAGVGAAVVSSGISACSGGGRGTFEHGVASGDPLTTQVILWTRVTPNNPDRDVTVMWEVATDADFTNLMNMDETTTNADRDFTVKVDVTGLEAGTAYYYRFTVGSEVSTVGRTKTLPEGSVDQVKFVVFSCSNYPAGRFHVYAEAAKVEDADAALHLGDYIYEYGVGGYASQNAETLDRVSVPAEEITSLGDYRARHAQYRGDADLQAVHAAMAMIAVWDDHEVTNDTWREGAENHQADEGDFSERLQAAMQAYAEWMPIRPPVDEDISTIQRNFRFGDLVNLVMLDTRLVGRDLQLDFGDFVNGIGQVRQAEFDAAINDPNRTLLGTAQRDWLLGQLTDDDATWHVLGQQVLMGRMTLPAPVLPSDLNDPTSAPLTFDEYLLLFELSQLQPRILAKDPTLTKKEIAFWEKNATFFAVNAPLLFEPFVPYNLDAWDGYGAERDQILQAAVDQGRNLVVLAGDTHNAWANDLTLADGTAAGVEFATASVSSPGLEEFLGLTATADPLAAAESFEATLPFIISGLRYSNLLDRGFMTVTFTASEVTADWTYVTDIQADTYTVVESRGRSITVDAGTNAIGT